MSFANAWIMLKTPLSILQHASYIILGKNILQLGLNEMFQEYKPTGLFHQNAIQSLIFAYGSIHTLNFLHLRYQNHDTQAFVSFIVISKHGTCSMSKYICFTSLAAIVSSCSRHLRNLSSQEHKLIVYSLQLNRLYFLLQRVI